MELKFQDKQYNTTNSQNQNNTYLKKKKKIAQLIQERNIEFSGIIGYDESFFSINNEKYVRITSIDSKNHMILNDQIMKYEDFDKYFIEIFMTYSLKDLTPYSNPDIPNPKHSLLLTDLKKDTMITDGYTTYVPIIEKLHMTHQKCVFHKIMNQRTPVWKTTNKIERQLKNKEYIITSKYNDAVISNTVTVLPS